MATDSHFYLFQIEQLCGQVLNSIESLSHNLPMLGTFQRNFQYLTDRGEFTSLFEYLHECWCWTHPWYLFDESYKDTDRVLSLHGVSGTDFGRNDWTLKKMQHYKASSIHRDLFEQYRAYMSHLFEIVAPLCTKFGITLREDFTFTVGLSTDLSLKQLEALFYAAVTEKLVNSADRDKFLSIFDCSISASAGTISWLDMSKKHDSEGMPSPGYASLYTLIKCAHVDMCLSTLEVISQRFVDYLGRAIEPSQIKSRKGEAQTRLAGIFEKAILAT